MSINPEIDSTKYPDKFLLSSIVAKRARQIAENPHKTTEKRIKALCEMKKIEVFD